jgi:hypothetical protein
MKFQALCKETLEKRENYKLFPLFNNNLLTNNTYVYIKFRAVHNHHFRPGSIDLNRGHYYLKAF